VAHAVEIAGIKQRHAGVEGGADSRDAFGPIGRTIEIGHPHAAEAYGGSRGTRGAERAADH
jgi:hypothetical protein